MHPDCSDNLHVDYHTYVRPIKFCHIVVTSLIITCCRPCCSILLIFNLLNWEPDFIKWSVMSIALVIITPLYLIIIAFGEYTAVHACVSEQQLGQRSL